MLECNCNGRSGQACGMAFALFGICVCVCVWELYKKMYITGNGMRIYMKFHLLLFHIAIGCGFPFAVYATNCFLIFIGNRKSGRGNEGEDLLVA